MVTYRIATLADMPEVARVHQECFPGTFVSMFGQKLIADYYAEYLINEPFFVVAVNGDAIEGFCMGGTTGSQNQDRFISKYKARLAMRMLYLCLTFNKLAIKKCIAFAKYKYNKRRRAMQKKNPQQQSSAPVKPKEARAGILSICVTDSLKGTGAAKDLLKTYENLLTEHNVKTLLLSVLRDNTRAIAFYKKMGFDITEVKSEEYVMGKHLTVIEA